ncbi:MAG TPA: hypothetical protein VMR89_01440 [Actinomycetota bacterium]|nr:hypothetical protein [Actinomycetota bacterium]
MLGGAIDHESGKMNPSGFAYDPALLPHEIPDLALETAAEFGAVVDEAIEIGVCVVDCSSGTQLRFALQ